MHIPSQRDRRDPGLNASGKYEKAAPPPQCVHPGGNKKLENNCAPPAASAMGCLHPLPTLLINCQYAPHVARGEK